MSGSGRACVGELVGEDGEEVGDWVGVGVVTGSVTGSVQGWFTGSARRVGEWAVALHLLNDSSLAFPKMAADLGIRLSTAHAAVKRLIMLGLVRESAGADRRTRERKVNRRALLECLVGLVASRVHGRERMYRVNAAPLHEINVWTAQFEALWNERLDRLDDVLADLKQTPPQIGGNP